MVSGKWWLWWWCWWWWWWWPLGIPAPICPSRSVTEWEEGHGLLPPPPPPEQEVFSGIGEVTGDDTVWSDFTPTLFVWTEDAVLVDIGADTTGGGGGGWCRAVWDEAVEALKDDIGVIEEYAAA